MRRSLNLVAVLIAVVLTFPAAAEDVLIYDDFHAGPDSDLEFACNLTGDYGCTLAPDEATLIDGLGSGNYDIVMVDLLMGWFADPSSETALLDFIDGGGRAVLHLASLETHDSVADDLGAEVTASHNSPEDVNGSGAMFNNAANGGHSVPTPLSAGSNIGDSSPDQELDVSGSDPSSEAVFAYGTIYGEPAAVTSRSSTVVVLGFSPDETGRNDFDTDGVIDIREFLSNCIDFTLTCYDEDSDGDGFSTCGEPVDCDDDDDEIHPDALETPGDGIDSNCDGSDGEDADGDGHGSLESGGDDCDDDDDQVFPGTDELANGKDDDCDGDVDEGTELADDDGDGYCEGADLDGDGTDDCGDGSAPGDCDDEDDGVNPDVTESCYDDVDNNCDGLIDGEDEVSCPGVGDDDDDDTTPPGGSSTVGGCNCTTVAARTAGSIGPLALLVVLLPRRRR